MADMAGLNFEVGITVLKQYCELSKCVESVLASSVIPGRVLIVDNGRELLNHRCYSWINKVSIITPPSNVGVAAAWNILLKNIHPLIGIILNDDCEVAKYTFEKLLAVPGPAFVNGHKWSCFRQDPEITNMVGVYDEGYFPAYYEDCDFGVRIQKTGVKRVDLGDIVLRHGNHGERPYQNFNQLEMDEFRRGLELNKQRFISKWGGMPSDFGL